MSLDYEMLLLPMLHVETGYYNFLGHKKKTLWPLVRGRTIPTERPSLVDEI
jgi:hypothetical protein